MKRWDGFVKESLQWFAYCLPTWSGDEIFDAISCFPDWKGNRNKVVTLLKKFGGIPRDVFTILAAGEDESVEENIWITIMNAVHKASRDNGLHDAALLALHGPADTHNGSHRIFRIEPLDHEYLHAQAVTLFRSPDIANEAAQSSVKPFPMLWNHG